METRENLLVPYDIGHPATAPVNVVAEKEVLRSDDEKASLKLIDILLKNFLSTTLRSCPSLDSATSIMTEQSR